MVRANHHFILYPFFKFYSRLSIRSNFREVKIMNEFEDKNLPILAVFNHFSWWDGIFANYLNMKCFKRRFHFMVHAKLIKKFWFFRHLGAFSIQKDSVSIINTFTYTRELLQNKSNIVLIYPQGEIRTQHSSEIVFERGIEKIISIVDNDIQVILGVNLIDYFSHRKPTLYCYMKEFKLTGPNYKEIQEAYNIFYFACLAQHKKMIDRL
jgi:1-acyl-sn-glycerol-3-phosphate acyltransferase